MSQQFAGLLRQPHNWTNGCSIQKHSVLAFGWRENGFSEKQIENSVDLGIAMQSRVRYTHARRVFTKLHQTAHGTAPLVAEIVVGELEDALEIATPARCLVEMAR